MPRRGSRRGGARSQAGLLWLAGSALVCLCAIGAGVAGAGEEGAGEELPWGVLPGVSSWRRDWAKGEMQGWMQAFLQVEQQRSPSESPNPKP